MYSVGDRVLIRPDLEAFKYYDGVIAVNLMARMAGRETEIEKVVLHNRIGDELFGAPTYKLADGHGYHWTDSMLLPVIDSLPLDDCEFDLLEFI